MERQEVKHTLTAGYDSFGRLPRVKFSQKTVTEKKCNPLELINKPQKRD